VQSIRSTAAFPMIRFGEVRELKINGEGLNRAMGVFDGQVGDLVTGLR
jgi:hypothetical protein